MNYCESRKIIFIHPSRTGGGSVESMTGLTGGGDAKLGNYKSGHSMLRWYPKHMIETYYIFATVRNPWDRILSKFKWLHNPGNNLPRDIKTSEFSPEGFQCWLEWCTVDRSPTQIDTLTWWHGIAAQAEYMVVDNVQIYDRFDNELKDYSKTHNIPDFDKSKVRVNDFIRLEHFNQDVEKIKSYRPDIFTRKLKKVHVSTNKILNYSDWYTDTSKHIVQKWVQPDIDLFGYEF
jgi:hypothetical protein